MIVRGEIQLVNSAADDLSAKLYNTVKAPTRATVHVGSKLFVAVYAKSVVAEPIRTVHVRDLLVCQSCCTVYKRSL